jgi:hypothetical protein
LIRRLGRPVINGKIITQVLQLNSRTNFAAK